MKKFKLYYTNLTNKKKVRHLCLCKAGCKLEEIVIELPKIYYTMILKYRNEVKNNRIL